MTSVVVSDNRIVLHPENLGGLTVPELAVWGVAHYMATGDWTQYGVMPPPEMRDCPCPEKINAATVGSILGLTEEAARAIWVGLVMKGAVSHERSN